VLQARAETLALPPSALVHVDPDRRARLSTRARALSEYAPGLAFLSSLTTKVRGGAIKVGPASDFANHFGSAHLEVELVSHAGECKEATVWFGELSTCRRRATVLPAGASWTDGHGPPSPKVSISPISRWIYDPDPALVRSGLLDAFASAHSLDRSAPDVDYLTSGELVESPFLSAFEVVETLALDPKALQRSVDRHALGILEIKVRGHSLRPEALRSRLRLKGACSATLLVVGGANSARAVLAHRAT
jgi:hypothetical protein